MVVQWLGRNPRYGNSMAPLLISRQGYNKSTFCKSLLPPELQWGYNDNLVLSEKKAVLQAMSQFLLINLDEFNQISPKVQEGFLKNLIQLASVKVKPPYGKHVEDFPRLASFIATANVTDLLADPTGNRRFIGIELTGPINVSHRINYTQLYAQAMSLIDQGCQYWLDEEQTKLVMESNRQFQLRSPEEAFFHECFQIVAKEEEGQWMTAAAILHHMKRYAGSAVRGENVRSFGRFLSNLPEIISRHTRIGTEYLVAMRKA
jgi:predicted P-loop ATPase